MCNSFKEFVDKVSCKKVVLAKPNEVKLSTLEGCVVRQYPGTDKYASRRNLVVVEFIPNFPNGVWVPGNWSLWATVTREGKDTTEVKLRTRWSEDLRQRVLTCTLTSGNRECSISIQKILRGQEPMRSRGFKM